MFPTLQHRCATHEGSTVELTLWVGTQGRRPRGSTADTHLPCGGMGEGKTPSPVCHLWQVRELAPGSRKSGENSPGHVTASMMIVFSPSPLFFSLVFGSCFVLGEQLHGQRRWEDKWDREACCEIHRESKLREEKLTHPLLLSRLRSK